MTRKSSTASTATRRRALSETSSCSSSDSIDDDIDDLDLKGASSSSVRRRDGGSPVRHVKGNDHQKKQQQLLPELVKGPDVMRKRSLHGTSKKFIHDCLSDSSDDSMDDLPPRAFKTTKRPQLEVVRRTRISSLTKTVNSLTSVANPSGYDAQTSDDESDGTAELVRQLTKNASSRNRTASSSSSGTSKHHPTKGTEAIRNKEEPSSGRKDHTLQDKSASAGSSTHGQANFLENKNLSGQKDDNTDSSIEKVEWIRSVEMKSGSRRPRQSSSNQERGYIRQENKTSPVGERDSVEQSEQARRSPTVGGAARAPCPVLFELPTPSDSSSEDEHEQGAASVGTHRDAENRNGPLCHSLEDHFGLATGNRKSEQYPDSCKVPQRETGRWIDESTKNEKDLKFQTRFESKGPQSSVLFNYHESKAPSLESSTWPKQSAFEVRTPARADAGSISTRPYKTYQRTATEEYQTQLPGNPYVLHQQDVTNDELRQHYLNEQNNLAAVQYVSSRSAPSAYTSNRTESGGHSPIQTSEGQVLQSGFSDTYRMGHGDYFPKRSANGVEYGSGGNNGTILHPHRSNFYHPDSANQSGRLSTGPKFNVAARSFMGRQLNSASEGIAQPSSTFPEDDITEFHSEANSQNGRYGPRRVTEDHSRYMKPVGIDDLGSQTSFCPAQRDDQQQMGEQNQDTHSQSLRPDIATLQRPWPSAVTENPPKRRIRNPTASNHSLAASIVPNRARGNSMENLPIIQQGNNMDRRFPGKGIVNVAMLTMKESIRNSRHDIYGHVDASLVGRQIAPTSRVSSRFVDDDKGNTDDEVEIVERPGAVSAQLPSRSKPPVAARRKRAPSKAKRNAGSSKQRRRSGISRKTSTGRGRAKAASFGRRRGGRGGGSDSSGPWGASVYQQSIGPPRHREDPAFQNVGAEISF